MDDRDIFSKSMIIYKSVIVLLSFFFTTTATSIKEAWRINAMVSVTVILIAAFSAVIASALQLELDDRWLSAGDVIANITTGYADQPYCVVVKKHAACGNDGWVCTVTHNTRPEGSPGEKVYTSLSCDRGKSWTPLKAVEPNAAPSVENAYSTILRGNGGMLYQLYVENDGNVTQMPGYGKITRTDMLGHFFMRWSRDQGQSWSAERVQVPVRKTKIDLQNEWNGTVQMMWIVDKGFSLPSGDAFVAFAKIGTYCVNPPTSSWVLHSPNLATAKDPRDIVWETLPKGDDGVHNWKWGEAAGISEEPHVMPLDETGKNLYMVFRTTTGFLGARSSHDGGNSWTGGDNAKLTDPVRDMKNPRGPTQMVFLDREYCQEMGWNLAKGKVGVYLLLWYNNGESSYLSRNPYWISAGYGDGQQIFWTDPEIALYTTQKGRGPGYPDFLLDSEGVFITETQKVFARVHKVDNELIKGLIEYGSVKYVPANMSAHAAAGQVIAVPALPELVAGYQSGFSFVFTLSSAVSDPLVVIDTRKSSLSGGILVTASSSSTGTFATLLLFNSTGGVAGNVSTSGCASGSGDLFFAFAVDGGASVIKAFSNGQLCDGGEHAIQGWTAIAPNVTMGSTQISMNVPTAVAFLSAYSRSLSTSEMKAYWRQSSDLLFKQ